MSRQYLKNMKTQNYSSSVYQNLPTFREAQKQLELHRNKIDVMGDVICQHDMHQEIGITLLHKHFDLECNEILVRKFQNNSFSIYPQKTNQEEVIPYMWIFKQENAKWSIYPTEFITFSDKTLPLQEISRKVEQNVSMLQDIANVLCHYSIDTTFGISLMPYRLFNLGADECLMETEDKQERSLLVSTVPTLSLNEDETTQTLWFFTKNKVPNTLIINGTICISHCSSHCKHTCNKHC